MSKFGKSTFDAPNYKISVVSHLKFLMINCTPLPYIVNKTNKKYWCVTLSHCKFAEMAYESPTRLLSWVINKPQLFCSSSSI